MASPTPVSMYPPGPVHFVAPRWQPALFAPRLHRNQSNRQGILPRITRMARMVGDIRAFIRVISAIRGQKTSVHSAISDPVAARATTRSAGNPEAIVSFCAKIAARFNASSSVEEQSARFS